MSVHQEIHGQIQESTEIGGPLVRHTSKVRKLGVAEIILAVLVIAVGIATVVITFPEYAKYCESMNFNYCSITINFFTYSPFIWCGIVAIVTGGVGVGLQPTKSNHVTNLAIAIICVVVAFSAVVLSGIRAAEFSMISTRLVLFHALMAVLTSVLMIVCIVHAVLCYGGARYVAIPEGVQSQITLAQQPNGYLNRPPTYDPEQNWQQQNTNQPTAQIPIASPYP